MSSKHNDQFARRLGRLAGLALFSPLLFMAWPNAAPTGSYIVQGHELTAVAAAVRAAGGRITTNWGLSSAHGATDRGATARFASVAGDRAHL